MAENIGKIIVKLSSLVTAFAGVYLVVIGDPAAGFSALCFSSLERIYYEIRWGSD